MARIYISIGSNIEPAPHIRSAIHALQARFGALQISSVYESEAVGFSGDNFYNLVVALDTDLDVEAVAAALRAIEDENGRERSGPRFSSRTVDLDLLLYDDLIREQPEPRLPRDEITRNAFVLQPLAEIAPQLRHPVLGTCYQELWAAFDKDSQQLWVVPFSFD